MSLNPQPVGNSQEQYEFFEVEDLAHTYSPKEQAFRNIDAELHFLIPVQFFIAQSCFCHQATQVPFRYGQFPVLRFCFAEFQYLIDKVQQS